MKRDPDPARAALASEKTEYELLAAIAAARLEKLVLERENEFLKHRIAEEDARLTRA